MFSVLNSGGETTSSFRSEESPDIHGGEALERAVESLRDLLVVSRVATSLDLTNTQTMVLGASAAFGPNNAGADTRTRVLGADLYWKWKSTTAFQGFPFLSFQSEVLTRKYETESRPSIDDALVTLPAETLVDDGAYAEILWGIQPRWVLGLRGDVANAGAASFDSELRADRTRISPALTWYPSEFSRIRLQYNLDRRNGFGDDHSIWLQMEFILGAHAAHRFLRRCDARRHGHPSLR
jgi:hypothetical protein